MGGWGAAEQTLFGRDGELTALDGVLNAAIAGQAGTVLLAGPAGIGKTALAHAATGRRAEMRVLEGACLPLLAVHVPFLGIRSLLRGAPVELAAPRLDGPPDADGLRALDDWVTGIAKDEPLALLLDDVQWADAATLDALMFLMAGPASRRLAIVLTLRADEADAPPGVRRWLADVRRLPRIVTVEPTPLDHAATQAQIASILGEVAHLSLVDEVFARSEGNPYFTRLIVQGLAPDARRSARVVPPDLRSAVLAAWRRLSDEGRAATAALSVAGQPMAAVELGRALGRDATAVRAALDEAEAEGVAVEGSDGAFWFRHPLTAEVLEAELPETERRRLHAAIADQLAAHAPRPPLRTAVAIADHLARGASPQEAREAASAAARHAEQDASWEDAIRMLQRLVDLLPADDPERVSALRRLAAAARRAGRVQAEHDAVLQLIDGLHDATGLSAREERTELLVRRAHLDFMTGAAFFDLGRARAVLAGAPAHTASHAMALAELAHSGAWHGDPQASAHAEAALAEAGACGEDRVLAYALAACAMLALLAEDAAAARALAAQAVAAAVRSQEWWALCHAALWEANAVDTWTAIPHAESIRRRIALLRAGGAPRALVAWLEADEAMALLFAGEAEPCARLLQGVFAADPGPVADVMSRLAAARLAVLQGRRAEATQHLARAEELFAVTHGFLAYPFDAIRAEVKVGCGDPEGAFAAASAGIALVDPSTMCEWLLPLAARALADGCRAAMDAGRDAEPWRERLRELRMRHPEIIVDVGSVTPLIERQLTGLAHLYRAEAARGLDLDEQHDAWAAAAEAFVGAQLPWEEAYARLRDAQTLLVHGGDRRGAGAQLRRALALARWLGAAPIELEARALGRRARIALGEATPVQELGALSALTRREREILSLVVAGRTYGDIARELWISEKTVSTHISHLLAKTGTANRTELAGLAERAIAAEEG